LVPLTAERHLKPVQRYRCPKTGKLISDEECGECEYFRGAEWECGEWTIFCDYKEGEEEK